MNTSNIQSFKPDEHLYFVNPTGTYTNLKTPKRRTDWSDHFQELFKALVWSNLGLDKNLVTILGGKKMF